MKFAAFALSLTVASMCFAKTPTEMAKAVTAEANKAIKAEKIEITEATKSRFSVLITYQLGAQVSRAKAKKDTEFIVRLILKQLVADGRHPGPDDWVFVHANAIQAAKGETRLGFISLGGSSYNFNFDRIEFDPN